jgi:acetolactate synthase-1/3 small subunit
MSATNTTDEHKIIIGAVVNNQFGVLMRITELFTKRCYNIDSLEVGVTDDPSLSRMTIVATGDSYVEAQIIKQLSKLHDVRFAAIIPQEHAAVREHMLVKLKAAPNANGALTNLINTYAAKIIDMTTDALIVEVTGEVESNDAFVEEARQYGIIEICRAGAQALHRGAESL